MKKIMGLLLAMALLTGCSGLQIGQNDATLLAIELAAYNAGFYIGSKGIDDTALQTAYEFARTGQLSPAEVAEAMSKLKIQNAQLAGSLMIVLSSMGATTNTDGGLVSLSGIPVEYWDRAAQGYVAGYAMGQVNKKAVMVSKVKPVRK